MLQSIAVLSPLYVCGFWALVFINSSFRKNKARYFLGYFMVTAFFLYLGHSLFFLEKFSLYIHYDPIYIAASLMVYPMYYQYIRLLTADTRWSANYMLHYVPAFIMGLFTLIVHHISHNQIHDDLEAYFHRSYRLMFDLADGLFLNSLVYSLHRIVFASQIILYFFLGYRLIRKHRERIANYYSNHENRNIRWASYIFMSLVITALLSMVFNVTGKFMFVHQPELLLIPSALFSIMLFILGFLANGQDQVVREMVKADQHECISLEDKLPLHGDIAVKLEQLFDHEKIHLNNDLTIWDVSARLGTNRTYLSNFINKHYNVNFSTFVNRYRIADARRLLIGDEGNRFSLEVIGEKCGFGSYNNFIRAFREQERLTPGRYRDLHKDSQL